MGNLTVTLPVKELEDGRMWLLLSHISKGHLVRAYAVGKQRSVTEKPSGHRISEIRVEGSVKCTPTSQWQLSEFLRRQAVEEE